MSEGFADGGDFLRSLRLSVIITPMVPILTLIFVIALSMFVTKAATITLMHVLDSL